MNNLMQDIKLNNEIIKEFENYYFKNLGVYDDIATGYFEIIRRLKEENEAI